jgi:membrane-bound lytic murein transglycosylase D
LNARNPRSSSRRLSLSAFLALGVCHGGWLIGGVKPASAESSTAAARSSHSAFSVPRGLRPRVDFWKQVFSRYGQNDVIIHHRMYPQVVFGVASVSEEVQGLSGVEAERVRANRESDALKQVQGAIARIVDNGGPTSPLEHKIVAAMAAIPGGASKFQRIVDEDLVRSQRGIREKFADAIARSGRYLAGMERIFESEGLPKELTRIPFIESSFDYTATSSVGAAGIWQFMKSTAKSFMRVGPIIDERRDPFVASRAAAKYLKHAYEALGSWPLAITSYNHGVAGVAKKVEQLGSSDITTIVEHDSVRLLGFASNNFYPEFLAALEVFEDRGRLFPSVRPESPVEYKTVELRYAQSGRDLAARTGVETDTLASLNLALTPAVWTGRVKIPSGYEVKLPVHRGNSYFAESVVAGRGESQTSSFYGGTLYHIVRSGETLARIADKYEMTVSRIRALNRFSDSHEIEAGDRILVHEPHALGKEREEHIGQLPPLRAVVGKLAHSQPSEKVEYKAKRAGSQKKAASAPAKKPKGVKASKSQKGRKKK